MPCAGKDGGSLNKVEMIQAPKGKSSWGNLIRQGSLKLAKLYEVPRRVCKAFVAIRYLGSDLDLIWGGSAGQPNKEKNPECRHSRLENKRLDFKRERHLIKYLILLVPPPLR